jgi:N-acetylmuramoyl-L-alanine amidase
MVNGVRRPLVVVMCLVLAGCGTQAAGTPTPAPDVTTTGPATTVSTAPPPATAPRSTKAAPKPTKNKPAPPPASGVVVLDPGHNGGNASNPAAINKPVPAGRGQTKPCNTTGTATNAGFPEHAFTWAVSLRVRDILVARGVKVLLTRPDDTGVGPCVNARAAAGNNASADAVVSIHADGSTDPSAHGFHVAYSSPPLNAQQGEPSMRLARAMRDGLRSAGFPLSSYIGSQGLSPRADLGGLNLSTRPAVLVECGNMRNATEAAAFSSKPGQRSYAAAIAAAILAYLG